MSDHDPIEIKPKANTPVLPAAATPEDSGSRALSEALDSSFFIVKILMGILVGAFLFSGFFNVGEGQRAIILRFGKPVGEGEGALLGPGLHAAFPRPIDEVRKVSIGQIQTATSTVGWYATTPLAEATNQEPPPRNSLSPAADGYAMTADANIIHVRATLRYRITNPIRFLFDYVDAGDFVTNALNNSMLYASARFNVNDILTVKATEFKEAIQSRAKELIDQQNLGIVIQQLDVTPIPPRQLKEKFAEVLAANIKADEVLTKAGSYTNDVLSKARAEADTRISFAQSERARMVGLVEAEAKLFCDLLPQYQTNRELFVNMRQTETLGKVLGKAQDKFVLRNRADGKPSEVRVLLNREPQAPTPVPPAE